MVIFRIHFFLQCISPRALEPQILEVNYSGETGSSQSWDCTEHGSAQEVVWEKGGQQDVPLSPSAFLPHGVGGI